MLLSVNSSAYPSTAALCWGALELQGSSIRASSQVLYSISRTLSHRRLIDCVTVTLISISLFCALQTAHILNFLNQNITIIQFSFTYGVTKWWLWVLLWWERRPSITWLFNPVFCVRWCLRSSSLTECKGWLYIS